MLGIMKPTILGGIDLIFTDAKTENFDFIVVGLGIQGDSLATQLSDGGNRTLLMEFRPHTDITVKNSEPAELEKLSEVDSAAWASFSLNFLQSGNAGQAHDCKPEYKTPDGRVFIGVDAPKGSKMIGMLHAQKMTLGSCMAHNTLVTMYKRQGGSNKVMMMGHESWTEEDLPRLKCTLFEGNRTAGEDFECAKCVLGEPEKQDTCDNGIWTLP